MIWRHRLEAVPPSCAAEPPGGYQVSDAPILDLLEDLLRLEVPLPVGQQLGQVEERDALGEELSDHAA